MIRATNGVCLISVEEQLLPNFVNSNLVYLSDLVLQLTSFKDHTEMKIGDYDGTIKLVKQPKIHGLICPPLAEFDIYALKLLKKTGI